MNVFFGWRSYLLICLFLFPFCFVCTGDAGLIKLEERVEKLLRGDNISLRHEIADVYRLGDLYLESGKESKALGLFMKALTVDAWNLKYQLKAGRILSNIGRRIEAIDKAKTVFDYSENDELIGEAKTLLKDLGHEFANKENIEVNENVVIEIVPIGKINMTLVEEVRRELEKKLGIKYTISDMALEVGAIDRTYSEHHLNNVIENIKKEANAVELVVLLKEVGIDDLDKCSYVKKKKLVEKVLIDSGISKDVLEKFHENMRIGEQQGQYDVSGYLDVLKRDFKANGRPKYAGLLGITEVDIYAGDNNFLFGSAAKGYGAMSYCRFLSGFNNAPDNRPKLVDRTVKQCVSSSFFILDIKRCTSPMCSRAYPHSLTEHDQKGSEICVVCRSKLKSAVAKAGNGNY